jgi:TRAP-type C4-dicarboxylate transport system substrate-binding protein
MSKMKKPIFAFFVVLMLSVLCYVDSEAREKSKITIKIATLAPRKSSIMNIMEGFRTAVNKATNREVDFKIYYGGIQGDDGDVLRKVRLGQLHGGIFTGFALGRIAPPVRVTEIPFVFRNTDEVAYVRAKLEDTMSKYFEEAGYVVFGWHDIGFVYFFSRYPITSIDILRKQKVWVWGNDPMMTAAYKALGISAIPLSPIDVLTSLSSNLIDTAPINPLGAVALRWYTKFKYMNGLPGGNAMGAVAVTGKIWNSISPASQKKIKEIAKIHFNRLTKSNIEVDRKSVDVLKNSGIKVVHFEDPETDLIEMGKKARESIVGKVYSRELLDQTLALLDEFRKIHPSRTFTRIE